jgi:hypothetical protein
MDGSLFYHRGLAHYSKGSLGAAVLRVFIRISLHLRRGTLAFGRSTARPLLFASDRAAGDAAADLEAALTKALDETLMPSCFYNLGLCKARSRCCCRCCCCRCCYCCCRCCCPSHLPPTHRLQVRLGNFEAAARALNAAGLPRDARARAQRR